MTSPGHLAIFYLLGQVFTFGFCLWWRAQESDTKDPDWIMLERGLGSSEAAEREWIYHYWLCPSALYGMLWPLFWTLFIMMIMGLKSSEHS